MFTKFDVILLLSGIFTTLILLVVLPIETLPMTLIALAPALICAFGITNSKLSQCFNCYK